MKLQVKTRTRSSEGLRFEQSGWLGPATGVGEPTWTVVVGDLRREPHHLLLIG